MKEQPVKKSGASFDNFASGVSKAAERTYAFLIAFSLVIIWAITGTVFNFF